MQHSRIGRCAVSTRDLMNNTHARLVRVLFRHWHFCSECSHLALASGFINQHGPQTSEFPCSLMNREYGRSRT